MDTKSKEKIIVVLGPTSSGKSSLAVQLAKEHTGEIISADSVQVYRGLDIGSGKITKDEMQGVPHHLLDVVNPHEYFSVVDFKKYTEKAIHAILERGKVPIIAGGTGLYIQALIDNVTSPEVPPNEKLRAKLNEKTAEELFDKLKKLDARRAETIDKENPRRLVRALEIIDALGAVPEKDMGFPNDYTQSNYDILQIGLELPKEALQANIHTRTEERLHNGFMEEVAKLHEAGLSFDRIKEFGLGYRCVAEYLESHTSSKNYTVILQNIGIDDAEMQKLMHCIETAEWRYAKRQMRWFKRDARINWFGQSDGDALREIASSFLNDLLYF